MRLSVLAAALLVSVGSPSLSAPMDDAEILEDRALADQDQTMDVPATSEDPDIRYDVSELPVPVRDTWEKLRAAAASGEIERLRPLLDASPEPPILSFGSPGEDPIEDLRSFSGDAQGSEILAILLEVLDAGYVHIDVGTEQEVYAWPYFVRVALDELTPEQRVELYTLLTQADVEEMREFGTYVFYRVGISPDGTWRYFVAGE